jgi:single-strand DNA-binding protein
MRERNTEVNEVTLIGNVGKDPEVRYLQSGDPVANFSLATSESWKNKAGEKQEKTQWHRVEVFGKPAQFVRDYIKKGTKLLVRGSIDYQEWTDKDGNQKYSTKIKVSSFKHFIEFAGPKPVNTQADAAPTSGAQAATEKYLAANPNPNQPQGEFQASDEDVPFAVVGLIPLAGALLAVCGVA